MDFDALVSEIVARVSEKLQNIPTTPLEDKPRLLILTQQHGEFCHTMLESVRIKEYYQTECALMQEYQCEPSNYEAAILFNLTNDALCKLADGMCDTPFTMLAQKLILSGKKVFIPAEEIELFQYKQTAPAAYYAMLSRKLEFLQTAGVTVCPKAELEDVILVGETAPCVCQCSEAAPVECAAEPAKTEPVKPAAPQVTAIEASITKKVISEKDMVAACVPGVTAIHVKHNAILTDLARDYVKSRRISIIRD